MRRREFILALGGAAVCPLIPGAQHLPIVGLVSMGASPTDPANFRERHQGAAAVVRAV